MIAVDVKLARGATPMHFAFETDAPVTGIFGPWGAGKTSLLHAIAGVLSPESGSVRVGEHVLFDRARRIDLPPHRRHLGLVFQEGRLFTHLSVRGNLRYGQRTKRVASAAMLPATRIIEMLGLDPLLGRRVRDLSGGERQRVALGRALLARPRVLLLDEPLASLDEDAKQRILALMQRVVEQTPVPILYISHDLGELRQMTDELVVIEGGRSIAHGAFRDLLRQPAAFAELRRLGPVNTLALTVEGHDAGAGLSRFRVRSAAADGSCTLVGPLLDQLPGAVITATVGPGEIALAKTAIDGISIRNQLRGVIASVTTHPDRSLIEVDVGVPLVVEVSHQTVTQMGLAAGSSIWCLIKSNAVRYRRRLGDP